mmetsp:Transcript_63840/g.185108  ORF Transcript_63840/g.185108 Transcript_63840/m.185108 type:complete len:115 (-) Transcript_63840:285-629(-)
MCRLGAVILAMVLAIGALMGMSLRLRLPLRCSRPPTWRPKWNAYLLLQQTHLCRKWCRHSLQWHPTSDIAVSLVTWYIIMRSRALAVTMRKFPWMIDLSSAVFQAVPPRLPERT